MPIPVILHSERDWHRYRSQHVTASTAAALLGVHPSLSPLGLFLEKTGKAEAQDETPPMKRGRLLEPVAVKLLTEMRPEWAITANTLDAGHVSYWFDDFLGLGATPDALAATSDGLAVVQIKSVEGSAFRKNWRDPDTHEIVPPLYVAVQAMVEAMLVGAPRAYAAALVVGWGVDLHVVEVPMVPRLFDRIVELTADFWTRVAEGRPYAPDYLKDERYIRELYADDDGTTVDLRDVERWEPLLADRARLKAIEAEGDAAGKLRKVIDTEIIDLLGNAKAGRLPDGTFISAGTTKRAGYTVQPTSFRTIRIKGGPAPSSAPTPSSAAGPAPMTF